VAPDATLIRNLVNLYAERLDDGDFDGVAALFAHATFGSSRRASPLTGTEEVRRVYDNVMLYDGRPRTKHVLTNHQITWQGDQASCRCSFTVLQAAPDVPLQIILVGRYEDRLARTPSGWEFRSRVIHVDFTGDLTHHQPT